MNGVYLFVRLVLAHFTFCTNVGTILGFGGLNLGVENYSLSGRYNFGSYLNHRRINFADDLLIFDGPL